MGEDTKYNTAVCAIRNDRIIDIAQILSPMWDLQLNGKDIEHFNDLIAQSKKSVDDACVAAINDDLFELRQCVRDVLYSKGETI